MSTNAIYVNGIMIKAPRQTQPEPETRLQYKSVEITSNTTTLVQPDQGYDGISEASIITNIQLPLQNTTITVPIHSTTVTTPSEGYYGISSLTTIVPEAPLQTISGSLRPGTSTTLTPLSPYIGFNQVSVTALPPTNQTKTTSITTNGNYIYVPDNGYDGLAQLNLNVDVQTPSPTGETITTTITQNTQLQLTPSSPNNMISLVNLNINVPSSPPSGYNDFKALLTTTSMQSECSFDTMKYAPGETFKLYSFSCGFYRNISTNIIKSFAYYTDINWTGADLICRTANFSNYTRSLLQLTLENTHTNEKLYLTRHYTSNLTTLTYMPTYRNEFFFHPSTLNNLSISNYFTSYTPTLSTYRYLTIYYNHSSGSTNYYTYLDSLNMTEWSGGNIFQPSTLTFLLAYDENELQWYALWIYTQKSTLTLPTYYYIKYGIQLESGQTSTYFGSTSLAISNTENGSDIILIQNRSSSNVATIYMTKSLFMQDWLNVINIDLTLPNAMDEE